MGSLCCLPMKTSYRLSEEGTGHEDAGNEEERRRRAAEAAEKRLQDQQKRGMTGPSSGPIRQAHAELPGDPGSNLRWQVS